MFTLLIDVAVFLTFDKTGFLSLESDFFFNPTADFRLPTLTISAQVFLTGCFFADDLKIKITLNNDISFHSMVSIGECQQNAQKN